MGDDTAAEILDCFTEHFGDNLRSIGYYDDGESDFVFLREDVESTYDSAEIGQVIRDIRLEAIDSRNQESMYAHGDLLCTVRCFENATELHIYVDETKGFMIGVDAGAIHDLREAVKLGREAVAE